MRGVLLGGEQASDAAGDLLQVQVPRAEWHGTRIVQGPGPRKIHSEKGLSTLTLGTLTEKNVAVPGLDLFALSRNANDPPING